MMAIETLCSIALRARTARSRIALGILTVLVMLPTAGIGDAAKGELGKLEAGTSMQALGGRVVLTVPKGAKDEARQDSIMSAPQSADEESRIVIDAGEERMVVMVWELFALAPDDLVASAKAELGQEAAAREIAAFAVADPKVRAVRVRPAKPALDNDAVLLDAAYLALTDATVVYVAVYANAKAFEDGAGVQALATNIIASAKGGEHQLSRQAGARALGDLSVTLPADVAVSVQHGPDFEVYLLRKMRALGAPPPGTMGVYVGQHPQLIHQQKEYAEIKATKVQGTLLGHDAEWDSWSTPQGMQTMEAIAPLPAPPETSVHVFVTAPESEGANAMRKIAETLRGAADVID